MGLVYVTGFLALVTLVLVAFMRWESKSARYFVEGRVTGIVGRKGHGKSLFAVHETLRHLGNPVWCRECGVKHRGVVASNTRLDLPAQLVPFYLFVESWDDLLSLPHATLVVLDEVHLWAPAVQGQQLPPRVRWLLSQCRKLHLEIMWVSQHEDRVSLGLRRQTDEVGICRRGFVKASMCVRFFDIDELPRARQHQRGANRVRPLWVFRYRVTRKLAAAYDTYQLLQPSSDTDEAVSVSRSERAGGPLAAAAARNELGRQLHPPRWSRSLSPARPPSDDFSSPAADVEASVTEPVSTIDPAEPGTVTAT